MTGYGIWAMMQARPGREDDARSFLEETHRRIGDDEPGTVSCHAVDLGEGCFGVFNTFVDEAARKTHVEGPIAEWVTASNTELFVAPYKVTGGALFATISRPLEKVS